MTEDNGETSRLMRIEQCHAIWASSAMLGCSRLGVAQCSVVWERTYAIEKIMREQKEGGKANERRGTRAVQPGAIWWGLQCLARSLFYHGTLTGPPKEGQVLHCFFDRYLQGGGHAECQTLVRRQCGTSSNWGNFCSRWSLSALVR